MLLLGAATGRLRGSMASTELSLYVLDCGHATFKDMGEFSDTGEYDGKSGDIADPCFLITAPQGRSLVGYRVGRQFAAIKDGSDAAPGVHLTVPVTLSRPAASPEA